ncbi:MAG: hypothetical protein KKI08_06445 [Armatimonadetes bacterium]|nr:hypothetical protein [Armatimonadota bacterium]
MPEKTICPFCRFPIKEGSRIHRCSRCKVLHHSECWRENGGCSTYGCRSRPNTAAAGALPVVCPSCGESNRERDRVCWACSAALPRPAEEGTPAAPGAAPTPPPTAESLPDLDLPEEEVALRQEAFEALLAVQSALELGVTMEKYSTELLKAKQAYDRLKLRSNYGDAGVFWAMAERVILDHQHAVTLWHLKFERAAGTNVLRTHIDVSSELGGSLLALYPTLADRIRPYNFWYNTWPYRQSIDDVLQIIWAEARQRLEQLRVCVRK